MQYSGRRRAPSPLFNLAEILVVVVIVGLASAAVAAGVSAMVSRSHRAACAASRHAAELASASYAAGPVAAGVWPHTWDDLLNAEDLDVKLGELQRDRVDPAHRIVGKGWTLVMSGDGASPPEFSCVTT